MRHHVLLDKQQMPKDSTSSHEGVHLDRCTETCSKHQDKIIEYYCQTHDILACSACAFADHRNCKDVDYIPDVSDELDKNKEFKDVQDQLRELEGKACRIIQNSQENISASDKYSKDAVTAVQAYIQEIVSTLDKLKKDLEAEAEKLQTENEEKLKAASTKSNAKLLEIKGILQGLTMLQESKQYCNLYVAVKKAHKALPTVARDLDITEHDITVADFKDKLKVQLRNFLNEQRAVGQIAVSQPTFDDNYTNRAGSTIVPADSGHVARKIPELVTAPKIRETTTKPPDVISQSTGQNPMKAEENIHKVATDPQMQDRSKSKPVGHSTDAIPGQAFENILKPTTDKSDKPCGDSFSPSKEAFTGNNKISAFDTHKNVTVQNIADIHIKPKHDEDNCWLSGVAVLPGDKLIAVDHKNDSVKVIDTRKQNMVYSLKLHSAPWDATYVDNGKAAVTLPNAKTIQYLNVSADGTVSTDRSINVNGGCHGIAFARDRLCVSFKYPGPLKVEILTLDGEVQVCVSNDATGQPIFSDPQFIAISPDTEIIYVSDYSKKAIILLSSTGKVLSVNKSEDWYSQYSITGIYAAADGTVYACDYGGCIHVLTPRCDKKRKLLDRNQIVCHPQGLVYNEATLQLFVGMLTGNKVKAIQLT